MGLIAHADRLLEVAEHSSPGLRAGILAGMAIDALMLRGDRVEAERLARRALADGPETAGALANTYTTLSICAGIAGDHERQLELLAEGQRRTIQELGADTAHNRAWWEMLIAGAEGNRGDMVAARVHADEAVRHARDAQFPYRLAQVLDTWANVVRPNDPDAAEDALAEAARIAPESLDASERGRNLVLRAQLRAAAGDTQTAVALLHQALVVWEHDIRVLDAMVAARRATAILDDLGQPRAAAVLVGAVTTGPHAQLLANLFRPHDREELQQTIDRLHATLGDDVYDAEAAHGATMSPDEILRFLRDAIDGLTDTPHD